MTVRKLSISVKLYATFALMAIGALAMDMAFDAEAPVWVTGPIGAAIAGTLVFAVMSARGVSTPGVMMTTSRMMGVFRQDERSRREVLALMGY